MEMHAPKCTGTRTVNWERFPACAVKRKKGMETTAWSGGQNRYGREYVVASRGSQAFAGTTAEQAMARLVSKGR